jgi:hypothetical protein
VTHAAWWLILDALAVYRLCHLIAIDKITAPIRDGLLNKAKRVAFDYATAHQNAPTPHDSNLYGKVWELIVCPWCLSVWVAPVIVALTRFCPGVWQYPAYALALTALTGIATELV